MLLTADLPFTKPTWEGPIKCGRKVASRSYSICDKIFWSWSIREIGLKDPGFRGSLPGLGSNFIKARLDSGRILPVLRMVLK